MHEAVAWRARVRSAMSNAPSGFGNIHWGNSGDMLWINNKQETLPMEGHWGMPKLRRLLSTDSDVGENIGTVIEGTRLDSAAAGAVGVGCAGGAGGGESKEGEDDAGRGAGGGGDGMGGMGGMGAIGGGGTGDTVERGGFTAEDMLMLHGDDDDDAPSAHERRRYGRIGAVTNRRLQQEFPDDSGAIPILPFPIRVDLGGDGLV